jgi:FMN-dependent NADH-azoreductase
MASLLHIDSSPRPDSVSRRVTREFADFWRAAHPAGATYTYRDLSAEPVPHIDADQIAVMHRVESIGERDLDAARDAGRTPAEKASWAVAWELIDEVMAADTIVLGVPMHNFSVSSTFKAWFDRLVVPPLVVDPGTGKGPLSGRKVVVITARGGAYGPGTPRQGFDFQEPYLKAAFGMVGLADDLTFLNSELTKSEHVPRLFGFKKMAADSLAVALDGARTIAKDGVTD